MSKEAWLQPSHKLQRNRAGSVLLGPRLHNLLVCSVEYWFRCMDLDGDGIISMYEMEFFYEEQVEKMEMLGIETLPFQDCLCQVCHLTI